MKIILKPGGIALVGILFASGGIVLFRARSSEPRAIAAVSPASSPESNASLAIPSLHQPLSGESVIDPDKQGWTLMTQKPAVALMRLTTDPRLPPNQSHMLHLEVSAVDPNKYWSAQLLKQVPQAVPGNHNLLVQFWGRSKKETPFFLVFEEGAPPHTAELQKRITLSPEWRQYQFPFRTTKDHTEIHANFCIKAGIQPGELDIANIHVVDKGPAQ